MTTRGGGHRTMKRARILPRSRRGADTMGMVAPVYYTADMVRALPDDGNRYEVVYGELLVSPAPRLWHQEVAQRLLVALTRLSRAGTRRACSRLPGGCCL